MSFVTLDAVLSAINNYHVVEEIVENIVRLHDYCWQVKEWHCDETSVTATYLRGSHDGPMDAATLVFPSSWLTMPIDEVRKLVQEKRETEERRVHDVVIYGVDLPPNDPEYFVTIHIYGDGRVFVKDGCSVGSVPDSATKLPLNATVLDPHGKLVDAAELMEKSYEIKVHGSYMRVIHIQDVNQAHAVIKASTETG